MRELVKILDVEDSGDQVSKKSGVAYRIRNAQCILTKEDGSQLVGILRLPKDMPSPPPGTYQPIWGIRKDFMTQEISSRLIELRPIAGAMDQKPMGAGPVNKVAGQGA